MPGFNIPSNRIPGGTSLASQLGDAVAAQPTVDNGVGPSNTQEILRNHRWLIKQLGPINPDKLIFAKEVSLPELRIDRQEILAGLNWYKFAKSTKWEDVTVSLYDEGTLLADIGNWRDQVYTPDGGIQSHDTYKQDCVFSLLNGDGLSVYDVTLTGAWPANISHSKLSFSDNQIKLITLTIAYDYATFKGTPGNLQ